MSRAESEPRHTPRPATVPRAMQLLRSAFAVAWPVLLALLATLVIMVGLPMVLTAAS